MWPAPFSYERRIPSQGPGSFWEDRGDRFHCGVDIYAPSGSYVVAMMDGEVLDVDKFTSPSWVPYWNDTYYVVIKLRTDLIAKYAELGNVVVKPGDKLKAGDIVGHVGLVVNRSKLDWKSPSYVRNLKSPSMLHFEFWKDEAITEHSFYLGGNWFSHIRPENIRDPSSYLRYESSNFGP